MKNGNQPVRGRQSQSIQTSPSINHHHKAQSVMQSRKKQNSKVLMQQKQRRRHFLTFLRIVKYGSNSFLRNAWLSVAATAVMTITLIIVFGTFLMKMTVNDTIDTLTEKIGVSIYLKKDVKDSDVEKMKKSIKGLSEVKKVDYISAKQNRENYASRNSSDSAVKTALIEASDEFFASFNITLYDIKDTASLKKLVDNNELIKSNLHPDKLPTYEDGNKRKESIDSIANGFNVVEKISFVAGMIFVLISSLIIFNTIRMAIFNRKEEIYMMKLIGANKSFISGPFIIESVICGVLAAIFASSLGCLVVNLATPKLSDWGIVLDKTVVSPINYVVVIFPILAIVGSLIGVAASWIATRKYLKI